MVATNQIKKLRESNLLLGDQPFSLPLELFRTQGKHPKVRILSSPLVKPWFSQGFSHLGPIALAFCAYPCMSMPAGAAPVEIVVLCAALNPGESSSESPESSQNPRFSRENLLVCSGGAGFELGEFESY